MDIENDRKRLHEWPKSNQERLRQDIIEDYFERDMSIVEIANRYNKRFDNVKRIIDTYKSRHTTARKPGSGKLESLTKGDKQRILKIIHENPHISCQKIVNQLELPCCGEIVRVYLHDSGYTWKEVKPTEEDKKSRFDWAKVHENFDFTPVIFTDESPLYLNFASYKGWFPKGFQPVQKVLFSSKLNIWGQLVLLDLSYFMCMLKILTHKFIKIF